MSERKLIDRINEVHEECKEWPEWMQELGGHDRRSGQRRGKPLDMKGLLNAFMWAGSVRRHGKDRRQS